MAPASDTKMDDQPQTPKKPEAAPQFSVTPRRQEQYINKFQQPTELLNESLELRTIIRESVLKYNGDNKAMEAMLWFAADEATKIVNELDLDRSVLGNHANSQPDAIPLKLPSPKKASAATRLDDGFNDLVHDTTESESESESEPEDDGNKDEYLGPRNKGKRRAIEPQESADAAPLVRDGLTQETAKIVSDSKHGIVSIPTPQYAFTEDLSAREVFQKQQQLVQFIAHKCEQKGHPNKGEYIVLCPEVANAYVDLITDKLMGIKAVNRINAIIESYTHGPLNQGIAKLARDTSVNPKLTHLDRALRNTIADVVENQLDTKNDFRTFRHIIANYDLACRFDETVKRLQESNDGYTRAFKEYLQGKGFGTGRGVTWASVLVSYYQHTELGLGIEDVNQYLRYARPVCTLTKYLGGPGILLVLPKETPVKLSRWTTGYLDDFLEKVAIVIPQLPVLGELLTEHVFAKIKDNRFNELVGKRVQVAAKDPSIYERFVQAFVPRPPIEADIMEISE